MRLPRRLLLALVATLVGSLLLAVPHPAGAQTATAPPVYPWTEGDGLGQRWTEFPGSTEYPVGSIPGESVDPMRWALGTFDPTGGYTFEAWLKFPEGQACRATTTCPLLSFSSSDPGSSSNTQPDYVWSTAINTTSSATSYRWNQRRRNYDAGSLLSNSSTSHTVTGTVGDWHLFTYTCGGSAPSSVTAWVDGYPMTLSENSCADTRTFGMACIFGSFNCTAGSSSNWDGAYICDAYLSVGALSSEQINARQTAIASGEVTGCGERTDPEKVPVPRLACGRTLRQVSDTQWIADVEAYVRNPSDDGNVTDSDGHWRVSWEPGVTYEGRRRSIPLPAEATSSDALYATYVMERVTTGGTIGLSSTQETAGEWVQTGPELPGGLGGVVTFPIWLADQVLNSRWTGIHDTEGQHHPEGAFGGAYEMIENDVPVVATASSDVKTVRAYCTVRVSPVTMGEDGGQTVVIIVDVPPGDDEPGDNFDDQDPDNDDGCSSDDSGIIGIVADVVEAIECGVGGLLDFLSDLFSIGGVIWEFFKDLLIPDNFDFLDDLQGSWSSRFPFSVIADAVGIAEGLDDRIRTGINGSPCTSIDPGLDEALPGAPTGLDDLKLTLPSPTGECGEDASTRKAADLAGWRSPIRALLGVAIWGAFAVRVVTSIGPGRTGLEPEPEGLAE
jgi:hypothetical protein